MLALKRRLLRDALFSTKHVTTIRVGRKTSGVDLVAELEREGESRVVVGPYPTKLARSPKFQISPQGKINVIFLTPRDLEFKKPPQPAAMLERAEELGFAACPDDAAFEQPTQKSITYDSYLYSMRNAHHDGLRWCFLRITHYDLSWEALGAWDGYTDIPLDMRVGFLVPEK